MLPNSLRDRWDGPHWRLWTLALGALIAGITALIAVVVATVVSADTASLLLALLVAEILVLSVAGSGMLDRLSRRLAAGGLAREQAAIADVDTDRSIAESRELQDRRTIRAAMLLLPILLLFVALLVF